MLALALGLAAGWSRAQTPLDFDSPFSKVVLLQGPLDRTEEVEIRRAKIVGENLEMVKLDESLFLAPVGKVRAILPKLPSQGSSFTQNDAQKAYALLQSAQQKWPDRVETSARTLKAWAELAGRPSPFEEKNEAQRSKDIDQWLGKIQPEEGTPRPVDLADYLREGERFADQKGPKAEEVRRQLEKVRNLMAMDFREIRGKELPTDWSESGLGVAGGIAAFLLLLVLWVFVNLGNFSTALKAGMIRTSQRGGESHTSISLKGLVYLVYAFLGGALLYFLLRVEELPPSPSPNAEAAVIAERGFYLSMNTTSRWSSQAKTSLSIPAPAVVSALQTMIPKEEFRLNSFLAFLGPQVIWTEGRIVWRQTLRIGFLPVCLDFQFHPAPGNFSLENPAIYTCRIGQIPLGGVLGRLIWDRFQPVTSNWDKSLGIQSGAIWSWREPSSIEINTPQVTGRKEESRLAGLANRKKAEFKDSISATELAQVFSDGDGDVYLNRTIQLKGQLKSVSSMRRLGNTMASEMTRAALAKTGGAEAVNAVAPNGQEDQPDAFMLETGGEGLDGKIQIKVLVKSPHVYYLDSRGDLYQVGSNPNVDSPTVARQKQALFKGGRVEGMERNVIEIYGAQPPEEVP